ncbi:hypothetical protein HQ945_05410 [Phyllobacterium sp. BT25]|uniref:Uncharacterized protein n=2 Tax=Phyllobacterium pellucidum TaxID=2740464 RepID=A0A849VKE8_9HYPH|nr:hypothetical protein [Phyllobacterium pellucidum]
MHFSADLLEYTRPQFLPFIHIDPDMEACGRFSVRWMPVITLKRWREGSRYDQCVMVHELVHHVQHSNGIPMNGNVFEGVNDLEIEAITVQVRWLKTVGENPRDHISYSTILTLTGDERFSSLDWLEAA